MTRKLKSGSTGCVAKIRSHAEYRLISAAARGRRRAVIRVSTATDERLTTLTSVSRTSDKRLTGVRRH
jgi:hypothetical protein